MFSIPPDFTAIPMERPETPAQEVASKDRQLSALMRAAQAFDLLNQRLQPVLSERARGHVQVACVEGNQLILSAESAAWATLARMEAEACLHAAREVWPGELRSAKVIVQKPAG
ncbi:MAG: DciA family protein [Pseudomonadota bacterium]